MMRIWLLLVIVMNIVPKLDAQERLVRFGVIGGAQLSTISGTTGSQSSKLGYNIGVTMDYGLAATYMKLGLILTHSGVEIKDGDITQTANLTYLKFPLHVAYRVGIGENKRLVFTGGPYLAYGFAGKWTGNGPNRGRSVFSGDSFIKFDYGLELTAGAEFGKIVVETGATFGIPNINNQSHDKQKTQSYHLSLGYKF
ncbi:MAG: porin family protein [Dysgonomonas sp.]|nr:porin family protein [Dysgonomonas sp.]